MTSTISAPFGVRAGGAIGGPGGGRPIATQPRRMSDAERRRMAVRLRRDGWSYNRIAQHLQMRYSLVAAIADGDTAPSPPTAAEGRRPQPPAAVPSPPPERDGLERKLDDLKAAVDRQNEALARLEASLPEVVAKAHDSLFDRLTQAMKDLFGRVLPGRSGGKDGA